MADLKDGSTSYPTSKDTATLVSAETSSPDHINGATQAIVAIENEIGIGLKGTQADLVTRLAKNIHDDGGVLRGTSFPVSPPNLPHWFWRTDLKQLYIYDTALASYQRVDSTNVHANLAGLTADDHTQYVHNTTARTISARHTFNPGSALPPFILHANAQGQTVTGFQADTAVLAETATNADNLFADGSYRVASQTPGANTIPLRGSGGDFPCDRIISGTCSSTSLIGAGGTSVQSTITIIIPAGKKLYIRRACYYFQEQIRLLVVGGSNTFTSSSYRSDETATTLLKDNSGGGTPATDIIQIKFYNPSGGGLNYNFSDSWMIQLTIE